MLKKNITFIYMDSAEKAFMTLLAEEANKRGFKTRITNNKFEKCEIGVYCQHVNFPQYSKFSVIMLHDIIQQYGNWPDIWLREPWNKYDIGILPSRQWGENWKKCSQYFYTKPKLGMYQVGWPKADRVANIDKKKYRKNFNIQYNLDDNKPTILYAPAWENDRKQDDFVKAMLELNVNILIKQWDADPEKFPQVVANIKEMYELHKDIEGVTILPPSMNIFDAILACDILVSEESSTMSEAAMLGIPAISVSDWLIPDVVPSRYPECNYDFVIKSTKRNLKDCVYEILENYSVYKRNVEVYSEQNFSNIGCSCQMIIDIIEDAISEKNIRYKSLKPANKERVPLKKYIFFVWISIKREIHDNYCERHPNAMKVWAIFSKIKKILKNKN